MGQRHAFTAVGKMSANMAMSRCVRDIDNESVVIKQPGATGNSWWQSLSFGSYFKSEKDLTPSSVTGTCGWEKFFHYNLKQWQPGLAIKVCV